MRKSSVAGAARAARPGPLPAWPPADARLELRQPKSRRGQRPMQLEVVLVGDPLLARGPFDGPQPRSQGVDLGRGPVLMDALAMLREFSTAQRLSERPLEFADPLREIRRLGFEGSPLGRREQAIHPSYPAPSPIATGELRSHRGARSAPVARPEDFDDFAYLRFADAHRGSIG